MSKNKSKAKNNNILILILIILTAILLSISYLYFYINSPKVINLNLTKVELAISPQQQATGLMFRDSLCSQCAMLFIYKTPSINNFWMKNTAISLDIFFIDYSGKIINIHENTEPFNTNRHYKPNSQYYYALETNAGFAKANNLKVGSVININQLLTVDH